MMKKRLLTIVALLVAFVMSFALVACGNKKEDNVIKPPELTGQQLQTAINNIKNAKTLELDISAHAASAKTKAVNYTAKATASGSKIMYNDTASGSSYIIDVNTGYGYMQSDNSGYVFERVLPSGLFDYAYDVIEAAAGSNVEVDYSEVVKEFEYDATYGGFVAKKAAAEQVNSVIKYAQDAYAKNYSLNDVINDVLRKLTGEPTIELEGIISLFVGGYDTIKVMPLSTLLGDNADELFDELFAAFEKAGIVYDDAQKAAVKNRKVGEFAAGAMSVLGAMTDGKSGALDIADIFTMLFITEYSQESIDSAGVMLAAGSNILITTLKSQKIPAFVDSAPADIKAMITSSDFGFKSIDASVSIKLDGSNISEIKIGGYIEHGYSGEVSDEMQFLNDNRYDASVTVGLTAKNTEESFDITFADMQNDSGASNIAIVKAYSGSDAVVYFETGGKEAAVSNIEVYAAHAETGYVTMPGAEVTYNATSTSFVIDSKTIATLIKDDNYENSLAILFDVSVDGQTVKNRITVVVAADARLETLLGMFGDL